MKIPIKLLEIRYNKDKRRFERKAINPTIKSIFDSGYVYPYPLVWNADKKMWIGRAVYGADDKEGDRFYLIRIRDFKFASKYKEYTNKIKQN